MSCHVLAGALVLDDAKGLLPALKTRPGLSSWYVFEEGAKAMNRKERKQKEKAQRQATAKLEQEAASTAAAAAADGADGEAAAAAAAAAAAVAAGPQEKEEEEEVAVLSEDPLVEACQKAGLRHYSDFEQVPEHARTRIRRGMFPPPKDTTVRLSVDDVDISCFGIVFMFLCCFRLIF